MYVSIYQHCTSCVSVCVFSSIVCVCVPCYGQHLTCYLVPVPCMLVLERRMSFVPFLSAVISLSFSLTSLSVFVLIILHLLILSIHSYHPFLSLFSVSSFLFHIIHSCLQLPSHEVVRGNGPLLSLVAVVAPLHQLPPWARALSHLLVHVCVDQLSLLRHPPSLPLSLELCMILLIEILWV
jgi:hypothetical protein